MIRLAVININALFKQIIKIIFIIIVIMIFIKIFQIICFSVKNINLENISTNSNIQMIKNNIAFSQNFEDEKVNGVLKNVLISELVIFAGAEENIMEKENQEEVIEIENIEIPENVELTNKNEEEIKLPENIDSTVKTYVIQEKNKRDIYTDFYKNVQIKNESNYQLTEEMVTPNVTYKNNKDLIIFHTHTCESYTKTQDSEYIETGNYRTTDLEKSVVRVGGELSNNLAAKGYNVIHDKTYHDYPAYTGSYSRSLSTVKNLLSVYNTVDAVFDIHRDALRE